MWVDIEDMGKANLDVSRSPEPPMKWRLKQWVELVDEGGAHAASAHVQLQWSRPSRAQSPERQLPLREKQPQGAPWLCRANVL